MRNGCVRGLMRAPPLRDRPGLTRKFSLSSRAMTRRLTSERADTRAAEHRSRQIASTRTIANKQRGSSSTHIASAIARKIEIHQEKCEGRHLHTLRRAILTPRKLAKSNVQTNPCDRREPANASSLYLAVTPSARRPARTSRRHLQMHRGSVNASAAPAERRVPSLQGCGGMEHRRWKGRWQAME